MPDNHSPFQDYKIFLDVVKSYTTTDTKVFWSCAILHDSFILPMVVCKSKYLLENRYRPLQTKIF